MAYRIFLSTLPARGATCGSTHTVTDCTNFYPRSPRGERPLMQRQYRPTSIFLSTLPARGATRNRRLERQQFGISIHAPREGSDEPTAAVHYGTLNFYPRSPRGERPAQRTFQFMAKEFLSTLPARGATRVPLRLAHPFEISIHAPREGSDGRCPGSKSLC